MKFVKIDRSSVTEQIIEYLKDQIFKQKLKPGQQLPSEENLGNQLGVGRGTLREALRVLVYLGLIERRNKSTYVTSIATSGDVMEGFIDRIHRHRDVMQVIEVRKIVEPEAAALAAENANAEDVAEIEKHLGEMEKHIGNYLEFVAHDEAFHKSIFNACGNHILLELMKSIHHYMHQNYVLVLRLRPTIAPHSLEYHRKIYAAIKEGNAEEAREIMKEHIFNIEEEMRLIIKSNASVTDKEYA